jgi:hypothetical protein
MFFNSNDPRTQLQARLDCESRSQHASDASCEETDFSDGSNGGGLTTTTITTSNSTTVPDGNRSDATRSSSSSRPIFGSGRTNSASKLKLAQ